MKGERPDRPPLGFPDALWDLVNTTWVEQRVNQPQSRPLVSTVLNRLKERADQWDKSIVPVVPKRWRESGGNRESLVDVLVRSHPFHSDDY